MIVLLYHDFRYVENLYGGSRDLSLFSLAVLNGELAYYCFAIVLRSLEAVAAHVFMRIKAPVSGWRKVGGN